MPRNERLLVVSLTTLMLAWIVAATAQALFEPMACQVLP